MGLPAARVVNPYVFIVGCARSGTTCPFRGARELRFQAAAGTAGSGSHGLPVGAAVTASKAVRAVRGGGVEVAAGAAPPGKGSLVVPVSGDGLVPLGGLGGLQTCAHDDPAGFAPSRPAPHREHCAGGSAVLRWSGSGSRRRPLPGWPGCPPRLRSLRRSRSDCWRFLRLALRRSLASTDSPDVGVPESVLSIPSRRCSPATWSSSRFRSSRSAASSARSKLISASFASTTARSRASSSRCSKSRPAGSGSSDTSLKLVQPELHLQVPESRRVAARQRRPASTSTP
jgi:hypothetical protein